MSKDAVGKDYFDDPERVADLLNGYCFKGKKIINPEDVEDAKEQLIWSEKQRDYIARTQDIVHKIVRGVNCFIIGQAHV